MSFFFTFITNTILMRFIIKLLLTAALVMLLSYLLPGITVVNYQAAIIVALVLALLNTFIKPLLIFLTIPVTLITLGLFLLVINAIIILIADYFISDFIVKGFWWAFIFSILLSISESILNKLVNDEK